MTKFYKPEIPFLRLVLFLIAGICFSIIFKIESQVYWLIFGLINLLILSYLNLYYAKHELYLKTYISGFFIHLFLFISGVIFCNQHKEINRPNHFSHFTAQKLIVYLIEDPKIKGDIAKFKVTVKQNINNGNSIVTTGKLLLAVKFDSTKRFQLQYGDLCIIESKFQETEPSYNPSEFNYKKYLSYQQVYHQSFINEKQLIKIGDNEGNPLKSFALNFRKQQVEKFNFYLKNKDAKAVAATLILGFRADLSQDILNAYGKTGTMHVLSVSGMHVAIVVILLGYLLGFMDKNRNARIAKAIIMIILIWFYALITGLDPSVSRAAIMLSFVIVAKAMNQKVNILNILGLSAIILLIDNPFNIANVGFQLSFIAVGGLIYLQPKIKGLFHPQNKIIEFIWASISVSIAAQLATTPISLYYFHNFPFYFLISNLFIAIPSVMIMYTGLAFLLFGWWPIGISTLGILLDKLIIFTNNGLIKIEQLKYASITQIWLSGIEIIIIYLLYIFFILSFKKPIYLKYTLLCVAFLVFNFGYQHLQQIKQKQVLFFSLRKNIAIALIKGNKATLISDLKPNEFTYSFSIKPYLDSCHIKYIEFINPQQTIGEKIITFEGYQLKIINHRNDIYLPSKINWLLLSGVKVQKIPEILKANSFDYLFLDGKNSNKVILDIKNRMTAKQLKAYILKREPAVEIKL